MALLKEPSKGLAEGPGAEAGHRPSLTAFQHSSWFFKRPTFLAFSAAQLSKDSSSPLA